MSQIVTLRPSEKVLTFLEEEFQLGKLPEGGRLPTIGDLAERLEVSEGTIKAAYRDLARRGLIYSVRGKGSFRAGSVPEPTDVNHYTIGINMTRFPTAREGLSYWATRLSSGILKASGESTTPIDIRLCGTAENQSDEELESRIAGLSGMIFYGMNVTDRFYNILQRHKIPVVTLNQPYINATENFVSPDYLGCSIRLGRVWRNVGKKRVLFFSAPHPDSSISVQERLGGLAAGLGDAFGQGCELRVLVNEMGEAEAAYERMKDFLSTGDWVPDAIYSAGDLMQEGILQALEEKGLCVPEQVSLVGGNGMIRNIGRNRRYTLASASHPAEQVGELLLKQLIRLIRNHGTALPGIIVPVPLLEGDTVTEAENAAIREFSLHLE